MRKLHQFVVIVCCIVSVQVILSFYCCTMPQQKADANPADMTIPQMIAKGKYLVTVGGCNDCHSPKIMTQMGPVVDSSKMLSGSPADMKLAPIDTNQIAPGKWYLGAADLTTWVGPWGISYSANLT
ncbi:MAG TPA: diheme cytochrome c-553, partial [Bacteroidia bacterium]|nr:diheme cytochrome c-553 [Bacteroidia bacterium]